MSHQEHCVEGEVWVNGQRTGARLAPYVTEFGFWLHNKAGGWGGPHFEIRLLPARLEAIVANAGDAVVGARLDAEPRGHVDGCDGYAAADGGSFRRPLTEVLFHLAREEGRTRFGFEGATGPLALDFYSVHAAGGIPRERMAPWTFWLWFVVDDDQLHAHFADRQALAAMQEYVRRAKDR